MLEVSGLLVSSHIGSSCSMALVTNPTPQVQPQLGVPECQVALVQEAGDQPISTSL